MQESLVRLAEWLSTTELSELIQAVSWVIPAVQSVHILSIAAVMSAAVVVFLRALGVVMRDQPLVEVTQRFLPWIWYPLIVLLLSGTVLIIGEPQRSLTNSIFQLKMMLLLGGIACTLLLQRPLRDRAGFWESTALARVGARLVAIVSLGLWSGIVFAGRWIAYVNE